MNILLPLLLGLMFAAAPVRAIEQNCRSIQAKMEREACYKQQEAELAEKRKQAVDAGSRRRPIPPNG